MMVTYIDPGTGSMLVSAIIASISVIYFLLKDKIYRVFSKKGEQGDSFNLNKHYKLVIYSEGKQYYNVFKPLLKEFVNRGINATFLTSDKEDPILSEELEGITAIFLGTGREAYYKLNRISADLVLMTTPGLDVLDIKRSKKVKHYCHITHSLGSCSNYRTFGLDYFDSVLIGGEGNVSVIRELESKRKLPRKEVKIIGHTYLDVLRQKIATENLPQNIFNNTRKTILISPTWGNHGLLTKYGTKILSIFDKSDLFNIIIRPHPQSFISQKELMEDLLLNFPNNENRFWDVDPVNLKSMFNSDLMISDFSGIIFDYFSLFKKPILTMRSHYEKRGRDVMDLDDEAWDLQLIDKIGLTIYEKDLENLPNLVIMTINQYEENLSLNIQEINDQLDKFPNMSAERGTNYLEAKINEIEYLDDSESEVQLEDYNLEYLKNNFAVDESKLKKNGIFNLNFWSDLLQPNFFLQMSLSSALFVFYIYASLYLLPKEGLNREFLTIFKPYVLLVFGCITGLFLINLWIRGKGKLNFQKKYESLEYIDIFFVLLPLTPILQYIFSNQDILTMFDSLIIVVRFLILSVLIILIIPIFLSPLVSKIFTIPISMSYLFIVINMASFGRTTSMKYIVLIMALFIIISMLSMFFNKKQLLAIIVTIFFLTNTLKTAFTNNSIINKPSISYYESDLLQLTKNRDLKRNPDIFLMIYDSYANQETMKMYGYDNDEQVNYLLDSGFAIYDGTYSLGPGSLFSMSQVLNITAVEENVNEYRRLISGEAEGLQFLKANDYNTHLIMENDYLIKGYSSLYNSVFPVETTAIKSYNIISSAILEGEFRFDIKFSEVTYKEFVYQKEQILKPKSKKPQFVYNHSSNPNHSQNSGVLLPDETERYFERLKIANQEMIIDINNIDLRNRNAIVIIAGDHGPYLTKNGIALVGEYDISEVDRLDIQDRFGTFLAIYWPDLNYVTRFKIQTIQDIFPAIVAYMYDDEALFEMLKVESETSFHRASVSGAFVKDGQIIGGINDGEPLFMNTQVRYKLNR